MEASPTCFCALQTGIKQAFSDTRCNSIWCTPQQLLSQLLPLLLRAQKQTALNQSVLFQNSLSQGRLFLRSSNRYKTSVLRHQMQLHLVYSPAAVISAAASTSQSTETNGPEPVCLVPKQPVSGPDSESTEPGYTVLLYGVYGPFHDPARRGSQQCAKPALARFVTLLQRLKPHGGTTVPSKLGPWYRPNPVLTGKTGTRGTTSRRRYRLNDPWYHRGWYRLFSPSLRHFAHLTLPNGRWRWIR